MSFLDLFGVKSRKSTKELRWEHASHRSAGNFGNRGRLERLIDRIPTRLTLTSFLFIRSYLISRFFMSDLSSAFEDFQPLFWAFLCPCHDAMGNECSADCAECGVRKAPANGKACATNWQSAQRIVSCTPEILKGFKSMNRYLDILIYIYIYR